MEGGISYHQFVAQKCVDERDKYAAMVEDIFLCALNYQRQEMNNFIGKFLV